jgi:hypothetical protein
VPRVTKEGYTMKHFLCSLLVGLGVGYLAAIPSVLAGAEQVYVKYRGPVDLSPFKCEWIERSSLVKRLCYDAKEKYVVVNLTGTYYHYCEVPPGVVASWRSADSMGRFYNSSVKGSFDCRLLRMPAYVK